MSKWLNLGGADDHAQCPAESSIRTTGADTPAALPPPPWQHWDDLCQVREDLQEHRYLLSRRAKHLRTEQQAQVDSLLASPIGRSLQVARRFLLEWYLLWHDADGHRRTLDEARERFAAWSSDSAYAAVAPLRRVQERMTAHFERLSQFLRNPCWEATNNGAERMGRAFRHRQAPHFNLRDVTSIEEAIVVMACQQKSAATTTALPQVARSQRGRKPDRYMEVRAAA